MVGKHCWLKKVRVALGLEKNPSAAAELPPIGEDGLLSEPAEAPEGQGGEAELAPDKPGGLARWGRRDQTLVRLQEGYERLNQLIEDIQKHLAAQGERSERICGSLEQLARSVGELPAAGRRQIETLEGIAGQIEAGNVRVGHLAESLGELPRASRSQTEALGAIKRTLEMTGEQNLVTSQSLEKLGTLVGTLTEANSSQVEVLRHMSTRTEASGEEFKDLLRKQNRRFVMLFVVTIVLAVGTIAAAIVGLAMRP